MSGPIPPRKPILMMTLGTISPQAPSLFPPGTHFCKMWGVGRDVLLGAETMMALVSWLPSFIPRSISNNVFLLRKHLGKAEEASLGTLGTEHRSYATRLSKSNWLGCVPSWGKSIFKQLRSVDETCWFSQMYLVPGPGWPTCSSCVYGSLCHQVWSAPSSQRRCPPQVWVVWAVPPQPPQTRSPAPGPKPGGWVSWKVTDSPSLGPGQWRSTEQRSSPQEPEQEMRAVGPGHFELICYAA